MAGTNANANDETPAAGTGGGGGGAEMSRVTTEPSDDAGAPAYVRVTTSPADTRTDGHSASATRATSRADENRKKKDREECKVGLRPAWWMLGETLPGQKKASLLISGEALDGPFRNQ